MNSVVKQFVQIALTVLKSAVNILDIIPGNQGEAEIRLAIKVLETLMVVDGSGVGKSQKLDGAYITSK